MKIASVAWCAVLFGALGMAGVEAGAAKQANEDESAVRSYTLPDVLAGPDGVAAATTEIWRTTVRPHQFALLETAVYGRRLPAVPVSVVGDVDRAEVTLANDTQAIRLQARLRLGDTPQAVTTDVLVYLPTNDQPAPVFLHLNFKGNQAEHPDPAIRMCEAWLPDDKRGEIVGNRATETSRAKDTRHWPVEQLLDRGYGVATACYGDVFPDRADGRAASAG